MEKIFLDAVTKLQSQSIIDWKKTGKPIVGYTCSYAPAEIFHAADILPVRLRGIESDGTQISDAYYGPFICSFPKCILQLAGKDGFSFLDGVVITPGCDSMRRLDECWRKAGDDYAGIVPDFFYYFDVPHKSEGHGLEWFIEELKKLIKSLERHFGVEIADDGLRAAIKEFNQGRRILKQIQDIRARDKVVVSGTDVFAATVAGTVMPRDKYTIALKKWLSILKNRKTSLSRGKKRLMLTGSVSDEIDLFMILEETGDAVVVAENLCFGIRYESSEISAEGDPIRALAEHYLGKSVCPRMYGKYKERLERIKTWTHRMKVDGVIMQNIRFCDLHAAENALFERDLEAIGIPCLKIEREYGAGNDTGRLKLRINAFLERITAQDQEDKIV
jgi:bcr-type benzoyl-CoA reductase subunit C